MPARTPHVPKYRHYKPKNLAVVRLDDRDVYLGPYNAPESRERYRRVVAEWLAVCTPQALPDVKTADAVTPSVTEVILAFWTRHADAHYRHADGTATGELGNFRDSLQPLNELYGTTPAKEFSPLKLKALRKSMIEAGLARTTINQRIGRVARMYKWSESEELVPAAVYHALRTVAALPRGRSGAKEPAPIQPVPDTDVEAVRTHVSRQVWAMVELQRLTGMRPGEVVIMRACDLDITADVWVYTPNRHKTSHRGRRRQIQLGPRAQAVLSPWLKTELTAYLFAPHEARAERFAQLRAQRQTKVPPSQQDRSKRGAKRRPGLRYTTHTYYKAIQAACTRAGIDPWHPNQLRHSAATRIRREFDLDAARIVLGHADLKTSEIYAERDQGKAAEVARAIG